MADAQGGTGIEPGAASDIPDGPASPAAPTPVPLAGRHLWWEVAAVLAVGVVPNAMAAVSHLCDPLPALPYWLDSLNLSVLSGCTIFVTLYLIGRSGEPWERFGVVRPSLWDVVFGGIFFVAAVLLWIFVPSFLWSEGGVRRYPFPTPHGTADHAMMVVKYGLSAFAEEIVTRAYLITRLTDLLRSRAEAVVMSAILFASYHAYQGAPGVAYTFAFGLVYGTGFLLIRRIWPLALGHALYNIRIELLVA